MKDELTFRPATAARWRDIEELFGARGACGGCWCMWWRLGRSEFERKKGAANKRALRSLVDSGVRPGILAYAGVRPVGWCALAPRDQYPVLDRSRTLARVDMKPVWSVTCFFVAKTFRRKGVTVGLLRAAVEEARRRGARVVEGYPLEPGASGKEGRHGPGTVPDLFAWTGLVSAFRKAGFKEVARRTPGRPIMRRSIRRRPGKRPGKDE